MSKREIRWPKREHLIQALDVFDQFRAACKLQLDLGYWMTVTFPSKHHLNKILSTQYIDKDLMTEVYGEILTKRLLDTIPACKGYLVFLRDTIDVEKNKN